MFVAVDATEGRTSVLHGCLIDNVMLEPRRVLISNPNKHFHAALQLPPPFTANMSEFTNGAGSADKKEDPKGDSKGDSKLSLTEQVRSIVSIGNNFVKISFKSSQESSAARF